jgi:Phytanoyl-CoA dioxygenase (PhyH)
MRLFRRRRARDGGGAAVIDRPPVTAEFSGGDAELRAEIDRLTEANRASRDPGVERRLLRLRHLAGLRALDAADGTARHPEPAADRLPADPLPEIPAGELDPALLRAGILRDGCLLVRGLVAREDAHAFAAEIDRAFAVRDQHEDDGSSPDGRYDEFVPDPRFQEISERPWIKEGGGVLAADSPRLAFDMLELFRRSGVLDLADAYLGEPALLSAQKTTMRRAEPQVGGAWHQDGAFMGDVRALNLWLALSRCGDEAPGLDLLPRRLDTLVETGTDDAVISYQVSNRAALAAAGDVEIVRPVFEPGDALLFDEMFLHQTASDPSMPNPRFAIESWFFGASAFPAGYAPIAT